jgi:energy-coupling factor transporter ATP-binding protein EcfA2
MFTAVRFQNFKSLRDFTIHLKDMNVLVGPNNAGKSTILDAFRIMMVAHSFASRRNPSPLQVNEQAIVGYDIPVPQIPISLANIHFDYETNRETSITFSLNNGNKLKLTFYDNSRCILTIDARQRTANTSQFKRHFPISIYSIPTLGPLEEEEELLSDEYVRQSIGTRRAHRMFRNIWYRWSDEFPIFQDLVERTWEGMTISRPELNRAYPPRLTMFCTEGRVDRELCWAGFGFQVWLQLLTHITNSAASNILIVDEPEIYLHPDLQHRLFHLLKATNKQIILATHSAEMVNEAEHDDVIIVNKAKRFATRVGDIEGLQEVLFSIGSAQNIHLARLSRGKRILFLEGDDYRLLRRFAARLGFDDLAENTNITAVPIGGFSQRQRIEDAAWTFEKVLKSEIAIAAILDRDYRCAEEIDELTRDARGSVPHFHVLERKELENYLLVPSAITRAINDRLADRKEPVVKISTENVEEMIDEITAEMKSAVLSQAISNRMHYFASRTSKDPATVASEAIAKLDENWADRSRRMKVVPGKQLLATLNSRLQKNLGISITATQIIRNLAQGTIATDLRETLHDINQFAK